MGEAKESIHKNNTWELVKLPKRRKFVGLAHHDLEFEQLDVKTAFLHSDLEEEIYMSQPEGFVVQGKEDYVLEVLMIVASIIKKAPSGSLIYLLLYVDDMLVAAKDIEEVNKLKTFLNTEFDMKDLGAARKILGVEIIRDQKHGKLFLSYKSYIEMIISRFVMNSEKSINTPSSTNFCLSNACSPQSEAYMEYTSHIPSASAVGSLMYAIVYMRPDIAHTMKVYGSSWKRALKCDETYFSLFEKDI
ncbi:retrovirus-related pol polyprotein from transposon TNT 1-94 [Tanacetum coccineum]